MSRVASLCGRAGKRAVTAREERLAGPVGREMKPETSDAPDDARRDLEQVQTIVPIVADADRVPARTARRKYAAATARGYAAAVGRHWRGSDGS